LKKNRIFFSQKISANGCFFESYLGI
jgi:hypothetical protein